MALKFGLEASFRNVQKWKGTWEKAGEVKSINPYSTHDETSSSALNRYVTLLAYYYFVCR
jgi:hypothetical protein